MFKKNLYYSDGTKVKSFGIFIAPIAITIVIGMPLVTKYPIPIAILIVSFIITFVLIMLCSLYIGLKTDIYFQNHNFKLWKKLKSHSLKNRLEAAKELRSLALETPYLIKNKKRIDNIIFILLSIWTTVFIIIFSIIIFLFLSN